MYKMAFGVANSMNNMELLHAPGMIFVFFDTETTGLLKYKDPLTDRMIEGEIVQLSAEKYVINKDLSMTLLEQKEWYIKPTTPVTPEASAVSHITNEMLADKPTWSDLHEEIKAFFANHVVIAHNLIKFDLPMIERMYKRMGDDFRPCGKIDTLQMARLCFPNAESRNLEKMIDLLHMGWKVKKLSSNGSYHDASTDVCAMVVLYEEMRNYADEVKGRFNVPRIICAWHTPLCYNHKNAATYFKTNSGVIRLLHYYNQWESDEIDFSKVNMKRFEDAVFEFTRTDNLTDLKKYGIRKEA